MLQRTKVSFDDFPSRAYRTSLGRLARSKFFDNGRTGGFEKKRERKKRKREKERERERERERGKENIITIIAF